MVVKLISMIKYLLDTDICIFFLKGKFEIGKKVKQVGITNCFVSEITLAELHYGAFKSTDYERHQRDVDDIVSFATVVPISEVLALYGQERARLESLGTPIQDFDLLIATTAVHHGMTLVTNNTKHHRRVADLVLDNWTELA